MIIKKPTSKPKNSNFSSGPCAKRPGWNINLLKNSPVGRSCLLYTTDAADE